MDAIDCYYYDLSAYAYGLDDQLMLGTNQGEILLNWMPSIVKNVLLLLSLYGRNLLWHDGEYLRMKGRPAGAV